MQMRMLFVFLYLIFASTAMASTRYCGTFSSTTQTSGYGWNVDCMGEQVSINGDATWDEQRQKWNISNCRYSTDAQSGCLLLSYGNIAAHCYTSNLILKPSATYIGEGDTIIYNQKIEDNHYECRACQAGYYVNIPADLQDCREEHIQDPHSPGGYYVEYMCGFVNCNDTHGETEAVCRCTPSAKGTYIELGWCDWSDLVGDRFSVSDITNRCRTAEECPIGQTTDSVGSTSVDACHYTADTQFCDAGGCFSLSDIQNWTPVP